MSTLVLLANTFCIRSGASLNPEDVAGRFERSRARRIRIN
jgi:hypothetical protein